MNACDIGRERIHALLDEGHASVPQGPLSEHLSSCPGCRELFEDLVALREGFRDMPTPSLPPDALEAVWRRTVRAPRKGWLSGGRRAAVAAVLVTGVSLTSLWLLRAPQAPVQPTPAEIARAEAQADLVFGYAARALAATRIAATRSVVAAKISPAVRGNAPSGPRRP